MSKSDTRRQESVGRIESVYEYDTEPFDQGGARYVRCTLCGAECIPADSELLAHRQSCVLWER